jgi:hypothetical protein
MVIGHVCVCMARDSFGLSLPSSKEFKPRVVEIGITTSPSDHIRQCVVVCAVGALSFLTLQKTTTPSYRLQGVFLLLGVGPTCINPSSCQTALCGVDPPWAGMLS